MKKNVAITTQLQQQKAVTIILTVTKAISIHTFNAMHIAIILSLTIELCGGECSVIQYSLEGKKSKADSLRNILYYLTEINIHSLAMLDVYFVLAGQKKIRIKILRTYLFLCFINNNF